MQPSTTSPRTKLEITLLLASFAIFLTTSLVVAVELPRGRGNDEDGHATYVRYVTDYHRLPDPRSIDFGVNREPHQPPLYYLGGSLWLRAARAVGLSQDSVRLYSTVVGAVWFWLVWLIARRLLPVGQRVLPSLTLASLPMAAQLAGTVNNDILEITLATLMLYAAVRVWQGSTRRELRTWYVLAALAGAGALLSKFFALGAVTVVAAALTYRAIKTKQLPAWLLGLTLAALPVIAFAAHNYATTGVLLPELNLGANPYVAAYRDPWDATTFLPFAAITWQTFIGRLGSWDIGLPTWFYLTHLAAWLAALAGLVRTKVHRLIVLAAVAFAASWPAYVYLNLSFFQPQARYVYAGLIGALLLAAVGWSALAQRLLARRVRAPWIVPALALVAFDLAGLVVTLLAL
ncbi:MAG: glycosyltransferase family 39 protein [Candidatus Andersenbacteria bacterium]